MESVLRDWENIELEEDIINSTEIRGCISGCISIFSRNRFLPAKE